MWFACTHIYTCLAHALLLLLLLLLDHHRRMLMRGRARRFVPATPLGVVELLSRAGVSLAGKTAVVLGDSNIVGTPLAALLRDEGAALVTICHRPSIHE
jgi:5,10-methylene-tetrahydrofolate dehydrogenase/methenyl tetrahydrofolate cyclohydrolase